MPEGTNIVVLGADRHLRELGKQNARTVNTLYHLHYTVPICREQTVVAALLDFTSKRAQSYALHF